MRICFLLVFFLVGISNLQSQVNPPAGVAFDDQDVPRIDIIIDEADLNWILDDDNLQSDQLFYADFIFASQLALDTLTDIGFRLRGNTSRNADKKSFKIDFNEFVPGRKFYGLEKMNLNGQHNDPLISRAKICSDLGILLNIPMMRTNHVRLYINDEYRGVYLNVEHIDEEFMGSRFENETGHLYKCLYPADLMYKGSNSELYKEEFWGRRAYTQKNKKLEENYDDIANFIDVLNNAESDNFACEIEEVFNVDRYLYCIIFDIITGNWDGPIYNKNNFYLYFDDLENRFEYIPFDLDNTLGIDWLNRDWGNRNLYTWKKTNEPRPLYSKIMENDVFRERFSYYFRQVLDEIYTEELLFLYLDEMRAKVYPFVEIDPFYALDYNFQLSDFYDGFDYADLPYSQTDYSLKDFIETRRESAYEQLETININPIITDVSNNSPNLFEEITINANIIDNIAIMNAQVCYSFDDNPEICVTLHDDGAHQDGEANDDIYGVVITPLQESGTFHYTIKASDINSNETLSPFCDQHEIFVEELEPKLAINEVAPVNNEGFLDEYGDENDWIELYNYGDLPISLSGKYLSDKEDEPLKWALPNVVIYPFEFVLIWADKDEEQGKWHSNFKLNDVGESVYLSKKTEDGFITIDETTFEILPESATWSRIPDGYGDFQFNLATPGSYNEYLAIDESSLLDFEITPNPVGNELLISLESEETNANFKIYNIQSTLLLEGQLNQEDNRIPIADWTSGMYYISIQSSSDRPKTKMFVKM